MKPLLVIMAAGMGSRYGGLKQIDPVGDYNQLIIDYSLYDAKEAGFETVVFIITKAIEDDFKEIIGNRIEKHFNVRYAYQELHDLPEGYSVPTDRVKPWGTAHAIYSARNVIDAPFAVINADDFYGGGAFHLAYNSLLEGKVNANRYTMIGYKLANTVTKHGHVARGICEVDKDNFLLSITERTKIEYKGSDICYYDEKSDKWHKTLPETIVSMNLWCFPMEILEKIEDEFVSFLSGLNNPKTDEFFLPSIVDTALHKWNISVDVKSTNENWYGVTYREDKEKVQTAIMQMTTDKVYPAKLWQDC